MNLTKISHVAGVRYLLNSVAVGDRSATGVSGGMAAYYAAAGTPPGRWWGAGAATLGIAGGQVTKPGAETLFSRFASPVTGLPLGTPPRELRDDPKDATAAGRPTVVSGFDLTFTIPKSVSVLWALSDQATQARILAAHHRAVDRALEWTEREVIATRSGRGGAVSSPVVGMVAARFDHWDTRDGDPHLHTHAAVANRVQRRHDGKWMTLDGAALYRSAVAISEMHENALLDELHHELGVDFTEHVHTTRASKAVVLDVTGVPPDLVERFSSRARQIELVQGELLDRFRSGHGGREPTRRELAVIHQQAWAATRAPKDKTPRPLAELVDGWRGQARALGHRPDEVVADALGHPQSTIGTHHLVGDAPALHQLATHLIAASLDAGHRHMAGAMATEKVANDGAGSVTAMAAEIAVSATKASRTTWTRANLRAEAERLTRLVRCDPGTREVMIEAITDAAVDRCVPLTPMRYQLPEIAQNDPRFDLGAGANVFDDQRRSVRYSHHDLLDAEAHLYDLATAITTRAALSAQAADTALDRAASGKGDRHPLAADQLAAARAVVTSPAVLSAVVGAAGTGKTTTMRAVRAAWEAQHGPGSVTGLATSAHAVVELSDALGVHTTTVAKHLWESIGEGAAARAARRAHAQELIDTGTQRERAVGRRIMASVVADEATYRLRPGQLVIVDEASMTGTLDLHRIAAQVEQVGGKFLLVGDPAQLGAVDAGGMLGWLDRTGKAERLSSLWRFSDPGEGAATLAVRAGDPSVFAEPTDSVEGGFYATEGRIVSGDTEAMLDGAYTAVRRAQRAGRHAILIAATNGQVTDLSRRFTLERRAEGTVDNTTTVALRDGLDAGIGDVILARMVDRRLRDDSGRPVYNGDLFTVSAIDPDGSVRAVRNDATRAQVVLPAEYLAEHTELGYATTAHRAQGITVDEAHLAIAPGEHMTRELLYVAMSRGRDINRVWVGLPTREDLQCQHVPWEDRPDATAILTRALAAESAERAAHEVRETETAERTSLARLVSEHDYLTALAAGPDLEQALRATHGDAFTDQAMHPTCTDTDQVGPDDIWEPLACLWNTARSIDPDRALRLLSLPISRPDPGETAAGDQPPDREDFNPVAVLHSRLSRALVHHPIGHDHARTWIGGLVPPIHTDDPALGEMARQNQDLITAHLESALDALRQDPPAWVRHLPARTEQNGRAWDRMAMAVLALRELHEVTTPTPLGPQPTGEDDRRFARDRARLSHLLNTWDRPEDTPLAVHEPPSDPCADVDWPAEPPLAETPRPDWRPIVRENASDTPDQDPPAPVVPGPLTDPDALRAVQVNTAAWHLWSTPPTGSWVPGYLTDRGLGSAEAGHAPAGWTTTLDALRERGFTDADLLAAGIATTTNSGRLIDRFRDRLVIPVRNTADQIVGFTARVSPTETWAEAPKYINTPTNAAYNKSTLLLGLDSGAVQALAGGARPVIVEGAMDVEAIRALGDRDLVPLAPCGTAITTAQLQTLGALRPDGLTDLLVAFDPDTAGRKAAARLWSMLDPRQAATAGHVALPAGADPADLIAFGHHDLLTAALTAPEPLTVLAVEDTIDTALAQAAAERAREQVRAAADVLAVLPPQAWDHEIAQARELLGRTLPAPLADCEIERILREQLNQRWDEQIITARDRRPDRPRPAGEDSELVRTARESWGLPATDSDDEAAPSTRASQPTDRPDPGDRERLPAGARLVLTDLPEHTSPGDVVVQCRDSTQVDEAMRTLQTLQHSTAATAEIHVAVGSATTRLALWHAMDGRQARTATCAQESANGSLWRVILEENTVTRTPDTPDDQVKVVEQVVAATRQIDQCSLPQAEEVIARRLGQPALVAYQAETSRLDVADAGRQTPMFPVVSDQRLGELGPDMPAVGR